MAQGTLVEGLIQDGRDLIDDLRRVNFPLAAVWWAKVLPEEDRMEERGEWQFFLASPMVDGQGPKVAYQTVYDALRSSQRGDAILGRISLGMITLLGVNNPISQDVLKIINRFPGRPPRMPPIYVGRCRLGVIEAEEVYIYPPSLWEKPWQPMTLKSPVEVSHPFAQREIQAMNELVASGVNPAPAVDRFLKERGEDKPKSYADKGAVVKGWVVDPPDDPNPLVLIMTEDGKLGLTPKSNTEHVTG